MSRFLKGLSSLMNGNPGGSSPRDGKAGEVAADTGPSTLTSPLFPIDGPEPAASGAPKRARRNGADSERNTSTEGAETVPPRDALVPLPAEPMLRKPPRQSASSRALNAVVRATTQVPVSTHVEPTPAPRVMRSGHRSTTVVLTETEKLRLQIMQVQLKLASLSLYDGPIDGLMNQDLVEAVRHFQTLKGMRDTGMLTAGTLTALGVHAID